MRLQESLPPVVTTATAVLVTALAGATLALADSGSIIVRVPSDATIRINGYQTSSTGSRRQYVSGNLKPGREYLYTIVATVNRTGQRLVREKNVTLHAGETIEVSLPEPYAQPPMPISERPIDVPLLRPYEQTVLKPESMTIDGSDFGYPSESLPLLSVPDLGEPNEDKAAYFAVTFKNLKLETELPPDAGDAAAEMPFPGPSMWPRAVLDGDGEAYVDLRLYGHKEPGIVMRTAEKRDVTGVLLFPSRDELLRVRFTLAAQSAGPAARSVFYRAKQSYYQWLLDSNLPGSAWFRHQLRYCQAASFGVNRFRGGQSKSTHARSHTDLMNWFELLTGGRAISENLWLDRQIENLRNERATVPVQSLRGIRVRPFDWRRLVTGLKPHLDPLAGKIPADQHALFFPSVEATVRLARQAAGAETLVLRLAQPRAEQMRTRQRYERQFCLTLDRLAEILTPELTGPMGPINNRA